MIKIQKLWREKSPPKVDVRVEGRGAGHPFEAEATTRFFGGGARARRSKTYTRPGGVEKRGTDAREEFSVSFGLERRGLEALQTKSP